MLPDSPGAFETNASNAGGTDSLIPHQSQTSQEGPPAPGTAHGIGISTAALATFRVDVDRADEHTVMTEQQQQDEESRVLYGDGSNPRQDGTDGRIRRSFIIVISFIFLIMFANAAALELEPGPELT